jgi:hypothetical protein
MFNITGNFQHGVYHANYPNKINGFQTMTMQREADADRVIECFMQAIAAGYIPTSPIVQKAVFEKAGVDINDLDDFNIKRIEKKVNEIWESKNNGI